MMDDEPGRCAEQFVRDDERTDRIASSLARPPAFRMTCASPSLSPAYLAGSRRASMQVRMANLRPGGSGNSALSPNPCAYAPFASRISSITGIGPSQESSRLAHRIFIALTL